MKIQTSQKLKEGLKICEEGNRSTEYTIQFLQDFAKVNHDCVMNFLYKNRDKKKGE